MKKRLLLFILITCTQTLVQAQHQQKITLQSISAAGMLNGSSGAGFSVQSILGVAVHRSFAGLGIGIDQYNLRSIPLFADVRQELGGRLRNVFLYGDAGYNFPWLTDTQKEKLWIYDPLNFHGGLYYDAGLGYAIKFRSRDALLFTAGYTYKQLNDKSSSLSCPFIGPCVTSYDTYKYHMPRIILKAGLRF